MLDQLKQLERRVGAARITLQRPRPGDWSGVVWRELPEPVDDVYVSAHGDTASDVIAQLLADPRTAA